MNSMIARYLAARERAVALRDFGVIREIDFQLQLHGYRPGDDKAIARAEAMAEAGARPARPKARRATKSD